MAFPSHFVVLTRGRTKTTLDSRGTSGESRSSSENPQMARHWSRQRWTTEPLPRRRPQRFARLTGKCCQTRSFARQVSPCFSNSLKSPSREFTSLRAKESCRSPPAVHVEPACPLLSPMWLRSLLVPRSKRGKNNREVPTTLVVDENVL